MTRRLACGIIPTWVVLLVIFLPGPAVCEIKITNNVFSGSNTAVELAGTGPAGRSCVDSNAKTVAEFHEILSQTAESTGPSSSHSARGSVGLETVSIGDDDVSHPSQSAGRLAIHTMLAKLWEQGLVYLDDPLGKYMEPALGDSGVLEIQDDDSELPTVTVDACGKTSTLAYQIRQPTRAPTVRDALAHAIGQPWDVEVLSCGPKSDRRQAVSRAVSGELDIARAPAVMLHDPGDFFSYGHGTRYVAQVVRNVTGLSLGDAMRALISGPLQLNSTTFAEGSDRAHTAPADMSALLSTISRGGIAPNGVRLLASSTVREFAQAGQAVPFWGADWGASRVAWSLFGAFAHGPVLSSDPYVFGWQPDSIDNKQRPRAKFGPVSIEPTSWQAARECVEYWGIHTGLYGKSLFGRICGQISDAVVQADPRNSLL